MTEPTPGAWSASHIAHGEYKIEADGELLARVFIQDGMNEAEANAFLMASAPAMRAALKAACGYMLNAKIDLETGAPKRTAIQTIEGGLRVVEAALLKADRTPALTPQQDGGAV